MATLAPGTARCSGPSTRDIILSDGDAPPEALTTESYEFLGDADIAFDRYTSAAFYDAEMQRLWPKVWQWACREEHVPDPGDYLTYDIGPYSVLVVRTEGGEIKAYRNACLHRGTQLKPSDSLGSSPQLRCSFHGWTWTLDGALKQVPCRWDFPHVRDDDYRLREVKVGLWGGFVFINLDRDAEPLGDWLGVLPGHFSDRWDLAERTVALHLQKELPTNWKAAQEAFLEAYHIVETHAQALPTAGDANAQYDVFGETVSRFVHTLGFPSPHHSEAQTQQQIVEKMGHAVTLAKGQTARDAAAKALRARIGGALNVDLSAYSTSEMVDSIEYHLFPNMCLFPGVSLPMIYRFRPLGVDRTLFDLMFLRPLAPGEDRPFPPDPVRLTVEQSYGEAPGMDAHLAAVFDQDTGNLAMQYKGFLASEKAGQTLGNYQEVRIRHLHQTIDRYLS